jgi:hypothetical protein
MSISSSDTLVHYNPSLPLVLCTDASETGISAILMQRFPDNTLRPISAASRRLSDAETRYSTIDREALAIIFGLDKFQQYLYGRHFSIRSDHKPLEYIFGAHTGLPKIAASRLSRWAILLNGYHYSVEYVPGKNNSAADVLSRLPLPSTAASAAEREQAAEVCKIRAINLDALPITSKCLRRRSVADPILAKVISFIERGWPEKRVLREQLGLMPYFEKRGELSFEDGVVMWHNRMVIPQSLQENILSMLHDGHPGIVAMKSIARFSVWWPGIDNAIETHVKQCISCQLNRPAEPETPLNPWNTPDGPWERIHIDFTGPFEGLQWFIVIDAYSRWVDITPMKSATTDHVIQQLRRLIASYGIPATVVSDNGSQFTATEFSEFCTANGIKHIRSSPYHSRTNGMVERVIRTFKEHFRSCKAQYPDLQHRLQVVLFTIRSTPNASTGRSPAELFLGRRLQTQLDRLKPDVRRTMDTSRTRQSSYHDEQCRNRTFCINDTVWVRDVQHDRGWLPGIIIRQTGLLSYIVNIDGRHQRRHADQLRLRTTENPDSDDDSTDTSNYAHQTTVPPQPVPVTTVTVPLPTPTSLDASNSVDVHSELTPQPMLTIPKQLDEQQDHASTDVSQPEVHAPALPPDKPRRSGRSRKAPKFFHEQYNY